MIPSLSLYLPRNRHHDSASPFAPLTKSHWRVDFFFMFVGGGIKPKLLLKRCDRQAGVNIRGTKEIPANIETILMKCVGWNGKPFSLRIQTISEPQSNSNKIMSFWLPVSQNDQVVSRPRNVYRYAN